MDFWAISLDTVQKLEKLNQQSGFLSKVFDGKRKTVSTLSELRNAKEPGVIPAIAGYIFDEDAKVRLAARETVHTLLQLVPLGRLVELDEKMRSVYTNNWRGLHPENLDNFPDVEYSNSVLELATFHPNGRIREASLRTIASGGEGASLPYVLIRMNDWVAPVRNLALQTAQSYLVPSYASNWLANLPLVQRLANCGRADHRAFIKSIGTFFQREEFKASLLQGLSAKEGGIRRLCLEFAMGCEPKFRIAILNNALTDSEPSIRLRALRQLISISGKSDLMILVQQMGSDSFMPIRRECLLALGETLFELSIPVFELSVFDRHMSIRETARYYLVKNKHADVSSMYRSVIFTADGEKLTAAICGIGETGQPSDVRLIMPFLSSNNTRRKLAALMALSRLSNSEYTPEFIIALGDKNRRVSRIAFAALVSRVHGANKASLIFLLKSSNLPHVRNNAFKLIRRFDKWESLSLLLNICVESDFSLVPLSEQALQAWLQSYNHSFTAPSIIQLNSCKKALDDCVGVLNANLRNNLQTLLDEWTLLVQGPASSTKNQEM